MASEMTPEALALIPDGNRRWSRGHKLSIFQGYNLGVKKFVEFSEWCIDYGINNLSVWAFSTENLRRPGAETKMLFEIYKKAANDKDIINRLHNNETRAVIVGNRDLLPKSLMTQLHKVELETKRYTKRTINMLIGYGGRDDLLEAAQSMVRDAVNKRLRYVNEAVFRRYLLSGAIPDVDMVIRTSGEERLSGLMPWQTGYAELYFSEKMWPEFTRKDLDAALTEYGRRQRRFGR